MKRTIFLKVFVGHCIIIFALMAMILLFSFQAIRSHYTQTLRRDLENLAATIDLEILPYLQEGRHAELDQILKGLGQKIQTRITIIDRQGVVLADSERDPGSMENHKTRPEIVRALTGHIGSTVRYSTTVEEEMLYVARPIIQGEEILGVVRVSLFLQDVNQLIGRLRAELIRIALVIAVLALAVTAWFAGGLSKPIKELRAAYAKVASGDFGSRVFLKSRDEFKDLADSFNDMTEQMQSTFKELSRQKEELKSIISSLEEGLIVLDQEGKIALSNESFSRMLTADSPQGKHYWEVIREPRFGKWIQEVILGKGNLSEEIQLGDRIYLCGANFMESQNGIVVVLHDITRRKRLEKVKRDFVVNISHELRTPLTAIKGYAETIEGIDQHAQPYLDIIKRNTERLIHIVNDLLTLSELEETGFELKLEQVELVSLLKKTLELFQSRIKQKGLSLDMKSKESIPPIKADPFRLEQLFINLIDNAIKYTEIGGIKIAVIETDNSVIVEIRDTGAGMTKEDLPRIFERFYVTDKSRSKNLAGTGLGLSIAKHIVLLHNGQISVESTPGVGTAVTVALPRAGV